jgi:hypothetical protein
MFKQRLLTKILVVGVIGMFWLSTNPTLLIPKTAYAEAIGQPAIQVTGQYCPFNAQEIQSLHTMTNGDNNEPILATSDGPIGYDGGTFALSQCRINK